jgi:hypothetical protein
MHKEGKLELLHRYLSGVEFRQRVEAVVDAFTAMRHDLDQERRAAERQWARRARQIDAVTLNVSRMYGDLQGSCRRCRRSACSNCRATSRPLPHSFQRAQVARELFADPKDAAGMPSGPYNHADFDPYLWIASGSV